jgi:hypothetical protein
MVPSWVSSWELTQDGWIRMYQDGSGVIVIKLFSFVTDDEAQ